MSFIEMQYMKKVNTCQLFCGRLPFVVLFFTQEMMNALHAMDEMMSANDINMNLAAITPFALLVWLGSKLSKFLFYALLKIGASREETYASLRNTLTDIERLLVMRDNPPQPPTLGSPDGGFTPPLTPGGPKASSVLGSDDLGMLMLLIHECHVILRYNRRRFSDAIVRSVSEDLAELAGERGRLLWDGVLIGVRFVCSLFSLYNECRGRQCSTTTEHRWPNVSNLSVLQGGQHRSSV